MSAMTQTRRAICFAPAASILLLLSSPLRSGSCERHENPAREVPRTTEAALTAGMQSPSKPGKSATLADFAWLEGHWRGDWGPRTAEQIWTAPKAGLMLGSFRLIEDDRTLLVEVYTLLHKADDIELRFRHFTPDLTPWEKFAAPLMILESYDATRFAFVNSADGQPKHAIFVRVNQDTYVSRFEIVPVNGKMRVVEITYHHQKPPRN